VPRLTFEELVVAAEQAIYRLGLTEPIDWVGNALGGHIGIHLAAAERPRLRTLTTIGTPVRGFTLGEKLTKGWPLVQMYRFTGPNGFLMKQLSDSLLGAEAVAAQPDQARTVIESFATADRDGMVHAMRSMMLRRSTVEDLLACITVPTLVMSARDDVFGWRPDEARHTCAVIPNCRVEDVAGGSEILIAKGGRAMARLVPLRRDDTPRRAGMMKGRLRIADDFERPWTEAVPLA